MSNSRIPDRLSDFDAYIKSVNTFLLITDPVTTKHNWERLGLISSEMTAITAELTLWYTGISAAPGAYELHSNKATKNQTTRADVVNIMKDFGTLFQPLLIRMSSSPNLTAGDMLTLHIKKRSGTHTHITQPVEDTISVVAVAAGTCTVKIMFKCIRTAHDGIPETADYVEAAMALVDPDCQDVETTGILRKTAPANVEDIGHREIHTKGKCQMSFESKYAGKDLYIYARYCLERHPDLAGPWSSVCVAKIPF